jgi:hypothetical protein
MDLAADPVRLFGGVGARLLVQLLDDPVERAVLVGVEVEGALDVISFLRDAKGSVAELPYFAMQPATLLGKHTARNHRSVASLELLPVFRSYR